MLDTQSVQSNSLTHWKTDGLVQSDRIEAWADALACSHLPWTLSESPDKSFSANISVRKFEDYSLLSCSCDAVKGYRHREEISHTQDGYFCLLYLKKGRELVTVDSRENLLEAGDLILWDSTQNMSFTVPEFIEKFSLMIPESKLLNLLPMAHDYAGQVLRKDGMSSMLANHMSNLQLEMSNLDEKQVSSLMPSTLAMIAAVLGGSIDPKSAATTRSNAYSIKQFIMMNLQNECLTPSWVAMNLNISPRYLHKIFQEENTSISQWIKHCRLEQCRDDIRKMNITGDTITDIAFSWGFNDLSNFSRSFRQAFGESPRAFAKGSKVGN